METDHRSHEHSLGRQVRSIAGREIVFDGEGFFIDFDDWSEEAFEFLAGQSGITAITELHWRVVRFLRAFYANNGRAPLNQQFKGGTGLSALELQCLFPEGIKLGARRLAGLPNPKTCN
jgi:TusE/DsrC/DsvC family sulfur relay protein